jgi:threonine dehydratase
VYVAVFLSRNDMITDPLRDLPAFADVEDAAQRLKGVTTRTPLLRYEELDRLVGAPVWIKPETMQRTGSFKMRTAAEAWSRSRRAITRRASPKAPACSACARPS